MATETTDTDAATEPKKSKKKLLIIVALVVALAAGGFWFTQMRGGEKKPEPGAVLVLEPISVNLTGGGYLKIGLALQFTADAAGHGGGPDGSKALDLTIAHYSQASLLDVTTKREKMKAELKDAIVEAYHHEVLDIYLTEYVSQ